MKILIVASSAKPPNFDEELRLGQRYRLEYLDLSEYLAASYMDYDPPWIHENKLLRKVEQKLHFDVYWAREIARRVKKEGYEAVIGMSERIAVPLAPMLNSRVKQMAIILNPRSSKWLSAMKVLRAHQKWDGIITYSHAETASLQRDLRIDPEKLHTVHNYVDTEFFKEAEGHQLEQDSPFIFSQGLAWRDYPTLIGAMRQIPHVTCQISAKSAWDDFKAGYEGLAIPDNVHLKSYNHPSIIRDVFSKCRCLVIPLRPNATMWCSGSTSVLQAQAMGKPVIVSYLPGIAEYVKEGETGLIVKGNSPAALAEAIDYLWQNPEKAEAMGQQAQAWVRENFSLEHWVRNVASVLERMA